MLTLPGFGRFVFGALVLLGIGCESPAQEPPPAPSSDASTPDARRCVPPPGVSGSPQTIDEVVALLNALPEPVTVACFLESLDRPLRVEATISRFSAQPAAGQRSPRIFLFIGDLVLSVVPDGIGAPLLELGEFVDEHHSRKAELELPHPHPLPASAPYDRVREGDHSVCGVCHGEEVRDESIDFATAYISRALRPREEDLIGLDLLRAEWLACSPAEEFERCAILEALFAHGPVVHQAFPETLSTL